MFQFINNTIAVCSKRVLSSLGLLLVIIDYVEVLTVILNIFTDHWRIDTSHLSRFSLRVAVTIRRGKMGWPTKNWHKSCFMTLQESTEVT